MICPYGGALHGMKAGEMNGLTNSRYGVPSDGPPKKYCSGPMRDGSTPALSRGTRRTFIGSQLVFAMSRIEVGSIETLPHSNTPAEPGYEIDPLVDGGVYRPSLRIDLN